MQNYSYNITLLILITTFLILLMAVLILVIIFLHRKKQIKFQEKINEIEVNYERNLLKTKLEIQEQTAQHISREIHDNITLSLTLAKLNLHTLDSNNKVKSGEKIAMSIELLTKSISELSDISKTLNADLIIQNGILKAIEDEIIRIRQTDLFDIKYEISGTPVYMDTQKELIVFRIVQEAFNNIIKHSQAKNTKLTLDYDIEKLNIIICDDGKGFDNLQTGPKSHAGLNNMATRTKILKGEMYISSQLNHGTTLRFNIPLQ